MLLVAAAVMVAAGEEAPRGAEARSAAGGVAWRVSGAPFRIELLSGSRTVTELGGDRFPFVYEDESGAEHRLTTLAGTRSTGQESTYTVRTDEPGRAATIVIRRRSGSVRIRWSFADPAGVSAVRVALRASRRAHFLGTGQRTRWVDMRGTVVPLKVRNACQSSSPSTFFASTAGFGAWAGTVAVGRIGFPAAVDDSNFACDLGAAPCSVGPPISAVRLCLKTNTIALDVAVGSIAEIVRQAATAQGRPRPPWLPQLALIKWRDSVEGPGELFDDITQMRSRKLPLGWVLLDNPWEQGAAVNACYGALRFDPVRYPDPRAMIARIHDKGIRFMLWISPQINRPNCAEPTLPDGWLTGDDKTFIRDLTLAAEREEFTTSLRALVQLGVDGFKGDRGDEVNLEGAMLAAGPGTVYQELYPLLYAQSAAAAMRPTRGTNFASLFRSFVPGSTKYLPGFIGPDRQHTWNGLSGAIKAAQTAGIAGAAVWGSDIGGYNGGTLTAELFTRWAQFAALTPIFEVGGAGANAKFWELGPAAVERFRKAATLHYELVPYLYRLAVEASATGIPIIRPLGLTWPADERAWAAPLEFTVGDGLLAAPVTAPAAGRGSVAASVYLPEGKWTDLFSGAQAKGPRTIVRHSTPSDFPLYVRRGAALPFNFREPSVWSDRWRADDLLRPSRQGWLVAPEPGRVSIAHDRTTTLTATATREGRIDMTVRRARKQQQLLVLPGRPICGIEANGRPLRRVTTASISRATSGWGIEPSRRKGVVLKIAASPAHLMLRLSPCSAGP